jgi:predicted TIM-barrel fold metal-dependent hydrolase
MKIYNTHIHTFRDIDIPSKFLPFKLVRILSTKIGFRIISKILNYLNPFSSNDLFKRYLRFVTIGKKKSQKEIFIECAKFYPKDTIFNILAMDMTYMNAGKVPRDYILQLEELWELKKEYPNLIRLFVHIDPRREGYYDIFKKAIEEYKFDGVKLYPSLGYFPYDERLNLIYDYCEKYNKPIIAHCSPANPVHYKGSRKKIKKLLKDAKIPITGKTRKELCANFTNPLNYKFVMEKYPNLKICVAHWGAETSWKQYLIHPEQESNWFYYIKDMIQNYPNFYTDISFTLNNKEYFSVLKVLLQNQAIGNKVLFGSDFYMVETETEEKRFCFDLRAFIGEDLFKSIAFDNPKTFLKE